jgi:dTDP-4-dehydrorhamnose 3,5-epimerase
MRFEETGLGEARVIHLKPHRDTRGAFARSWCRDSFEQAGITFDLVQANFSFTRERGTVRGMHFQRMPYPDDKIVRCSRGAIYEVVADVRPGSPTFGRWFATELSAENMKMMYVPKGFAQGFQSLTDDVVVEYLMGERYRPELYDGFRHDDPAAGIAWPLPVSTISDQDRRWTLLGERDLAAAPAAV